MDVFVIGPDGIVRSNWWNGNPWRGWFDLGGATFPAGAPIVAQSLNADTMLVAAVGTDGKPRVNKWNGQWGGWQEVGSVPFPPGAPLALIDLLFGVASDSYMRGNELRLNPYWFEIK
jgi:hypothetical protein